MVKQRRSAQSGFTLVETVIALFVFGFLILIFAGSIPVARKATDMNGQYAQAVSLCQHKVDQCRAVGYGRLTYSELYAAGIIDSTSTDSRNFTFTEVDNVGDIPTSPTATVLYSPTTKLDVDYNAPNAPNTSTAKVVVTVSWSNSTYGTKRSSVSLKTSIANAE